MHKTPTPPVGRPSELAPDPIRGRQVVPKAALQPLPSRATLAIIATTLLLAGCATTTPHERPPAPLPAHWPQSAPTTAGLDVAGVSWRTMLPDPRLQALVEAALEHNRDLRIAVARVAEARAQHGIVAADRLPNLNLNLNHTQSRTPANLGSGNNSEARRERRFDLALAVPTWEVDFWGRLERLDDAARAAYLASEAARDAFRLSLIGEVASAYLSTRELDERLALARDTVTNRAELRELVRHRRDAGLAGNLDFLAADGAHAAARAEVADLQRALAQAENALGLLVGDMPAALPAGLDLRTQAIPLDLAVDVPAQALLRRPDVQAAEQRLIAAEANIDAVRAAFLPRIVLSLALGTASRDISGLFGGGSAAWNLAAGLTQPLFNAGRTEANVELTEARRAATLAEYERTLQQAFREVADLLVARDRLAEQLAQQETAHAAQAQRLVLAEARFRAGITAYLDVLDAQRELHAAEQATVRTRAALLSSAAKLWKALGGSG